MSIHDIQANLSGVYSIRSEFCEKLYIGSSICIKKRVREHRYRLRNDIHNNKKLQDDWNHFGETSFVFSIVEECNADEIKQREQYYIDKYFDSGTMYNLCPNSNSSLGYKHDEDKIKKMKENKKGENNPMYKRHHSEASRMKIAKSQTGEGNPVAKLTENDVIEILIHTRDKTMTHEALAIRFGTSITNVSNIKNGKRWGYLKEIRSDLYE